MSDNNPMSPKNHQASEEMTPLVIFTPQFESKENVDLSFEAGQGLHANVNKNDVKANGCLISPKTIQNIKNYHQSHPTLEKLSKHDPEVQSLFEKHDTPRSILFLEDESAKKMVILYRDFSRDTVNLNILFESELPTPFNKWRFPSEKIPCLILDNNNKPKSFINSNKEIIPFFPEDYPREIIEIVNTSLMKETDSRAILLHSEHSLFEWLKSKGLLKGSILKESTKRLGAGRTTQGVKLAQDPLTKEWVAVKVMSVQESIKSTELGALKELGELYGSTTIGEKHYIAGKLHHGIHIDKFTETAAVQCPNDPQKNMLLIFNIMLSLATEMKRIHDKNRLHHDIHAANILVDATKQEVHFVDFGQSRNAKPGDGRLVEENQMISGILQALAYQAKINFLETLMQDQNKNLFYSSFCLPDKSDNFDLAPFIERLSNALNNKPIQIPKAKMEELEDLRKKSMQCLVMSIPEYYKLLEVENENRKTVNLLERRRWQYIDEESIILAIEDELYATDLLEKLPQTIEERNEIQAFRDKYLQKIRLSKNSIPLEFLKTQDATNIFVYYRIITECDNLLDKSKDLKPKHMP